MHRSLILLLGGLGAILLMTSAWADTHVSGTVSGSWTPVGSPYLVEGNLLVPEDSSLFIKPGVWVIFQGSYEFEIAGTIFACGIEGDSIYFTTNPGVRWHGFTFSWNPDTSAFYYCLFEHADNWPNEYGGVFYLYDSNIIVEHSTFQYNRANRGAAMYHLLGYACFRYNVCHDNRVFHCGGALNFGSDPGTIIERCVFYDNSTAGNPGGALYFWGDHTLVRNCTIVENASPAIYLINNSMTEFVNCIFWYNIMGDPYEISYSDVMGGWPGVGNINADPLFVNSYYKNFHLLPESPCIDAGDPLSPPDPDNSVADIGAYYYTEPGPGGDLYLDLDPINPPIIIPAAGDSFWFNATASYNGLNYTIFDAWVIIQYPDGSSSDPLYTQTNLYLAQGSSISKLIGWYVDGSSMPGTYIFRGCLGTLPHTVIATDSFLFEKEADVAFISPEPEPLTLQHSPNPFNPKTNFRFSLPQAGWVDLQVYDVSGRLAAALVEGNLEAGTHVYSWNASGLPSGVYLARLKTPAGVATERCLLVK